MDTRTVQMLKATRDLRLASALQAARRIAEDAALAVMTLEKEEGSVLRAVVYADALPHHMKALRDNLTAIQAADDVIELVRAEKAEAAGAAQEG